MNPTKRNRLVNWWFPLGLLTAGLGASWSCSGSSIDSNGAGFGGNGGSTSSALDGPAQGTGPATTGPGTASTGAGVTTSGGPATGSGATSSSGGPTTTSTGVTTATSGSTTTSSGATTSSGGPTTTSSGATSSTSGPTTTSTGAASSTGSGMDGGITPVAQDLSCGNVTVPAADVISDFRQTMPIMYEVGTRGGTTWYSYAADTASDPSTAPNTFAVDPATSGPCNSGGSLKVSSPGNSDYGVGFGLNFRGDMPAGTKQLYSASADGYTGVGFWMKCSADVEFVFFKVPDQANDAQVANPTCSYTGTPACNQYGSKNNVVLANTWTYYEEYFSEMVQDWDSATYGTGLDTTKLTAFQAQINTKYNRQGTTRLPNPFTCWVDDVYFLKKPAPVTPSPGTATTATLSGKTYTIAPGGYFTAGNHIYDSTGNIHKFRGLARPSFEWDPAGFGITREDIQRMKAWGANSVRFPINQEFWLSTGTKGQYSPVYQKYVDNAVQRVLQAGMDVIIDLHWNSANGGAAGQQQMATQPSITFWQQVATKYKGNGHIIFELYNEPHDVSPTVWKNGDGNWAGMQQLLNAVRGAGANNLVLAGGLDYAYDLSQVLPSQALSGTNAFNVAYVTHPYSIKSGGGLSDTAYGTLAATYPIVATEFGQTDVNGGTLACDAGTYTNMLAYFSSHNVASWTGWAWLVDPTQCGFPTLITSYSGSTNAAGAVVKAAIPGP